MDFAFAPLVGLLLGVASIAVPWDTLLLSVLLYIVVPVIAARALRRIMLARGGAKALDRLLGAMGPVSLVACSPRWRCFSAFGARRFSRSRW